MAPYLIYGLVYAGSALMAYNIYSYLQFSRRIRELGDWAQERKILYFPILLLILFLAGYLAIGIWGQPDLLIAGILSGGSVFVFFMLILIRRATDKIQENERLKAELTAAEEASKAKTFFLSNMSHDIRTPLNAIIGYTTLAGKDGISSEEKSRYIDKIERAGKSLLEIINDVLEMSRIESGKLDLEPVPMNLEAGIGEAADLVRTQLSLKQIRFTVACDIRHPWVLCDRNQLNRVLMNLLCNAGKFTPEKGEVHLSLKELDDEKQGRDDTGCPGRGRSRNERAHIQADRCECHAEAAGGNPAPRIKCSRGGSNTREEKPPVPALTA